MLHNVVPDEVVDSNFSCGTAGSSNSNINGKLWRYLICDVCYIIVLLYIYQIKNKSYTKLCVILL